MYKVKKRSRESSNFLTDSQSKTFILSGSIEQIKEEIFQIERRKKQSAFCPKPSGSFKVISL
jgi:hypothetical protein